MKHTLLTLLLLLMAMSLTSFNPATQKSSVAGQADLAAMSTADIDKFQDELKRVIGNPEEINIDGKNGNDVKVWIEVIDGVSSTSSGSSLEDYLAESGGSSDSESIRVLVHYETLQGFGKELEASTCESCALLPRGTSHSFEQSIKASALTGSTPKDQVRSFLKSNLGSFKSKIKTELTDEAQKIVDQKNCKNKKDKEEKLACQIDRVAELEDGKEKDKLLREIAKETKKLARSTKESDMEKLESIEDMLDDSEFDDLNDALELLTDTRDALIEYRDEEEMLREEMADARRMVRDGEREQERIRNSNMPLNQKFMLEQRAIQKQARGNTLVEQHRHYLNRSYEQFQWTLEELKAEAEEGRYRERESDGVYIGLKMEDYSSIAKAGRSSRRALDRDSGLLDGSSRDRVSISRNDTYNDRNSGPRNDDVPGRPGYRDYQSGYDRYQSVSQYDRSRQRAEGGNAYNNARNSMTQQSDRYNPIHNGPYPPQRGYDNRNSPPYNNQYSNQPGGQTASRFR